MQGTLGHLHAGNARAPACRAPACSCAWHWYSWAAPHHPASPLQISANNGVVTDNVLIAKAKLLRNEAGIAEDQFKVSSGWLHNFKSRFHVRCMELHGEAAAADMQGVGFARTVLPQVLAAYNIKVGIDCTRVTRLGDVSNTTLVQHAALHSTCADATHPFCRIPFTH